MFQNLAIKSTKIAPQKSIMLFMLCEISFYKSSIFHPPPPRESLNYIGQHTVHLYVLLYSTRTIKSTKDQTIFRFQT